MTNRLDKINRYNILLHKILAILDECHNDVKLEEDKELAVYICDYIVEVSKANKKLLDFLILKLKQYVESDKIDEDFNRLINPLKKDLDNE